MCDARNVWDEFERLRQMVHPRADWHLHNWGIWRRGDVVAEGYDEKSAGLGTGGISGEDGFEHWAEPIDGWSAEVSDAIIGELHLAHRMVLSNVYEASVITMRAGMMEKVLLEASEAFWKEAVMKDLT